MSLIRSLVMTPVWCVQIFGMSKSFKDNPVLGSPTLNRLGLHAGRLMLAHAVTRWRRLLLAPLASPEHRTAFARDGYLVIPDFLPPDQFAAIEREARNPSGEVRECIQGDTLTHRILLDEEALRHMPACGALLDHPVYDRLLRYTGASLKRPLYYLQSIKNGYAQGKADPQKTLHSDTFHPTMKAWYFLDDVDQARGPFTYVPGSHRLTRQRLKWEYERSFGAAGGGDPYSEKGSVRFAADDLKALGLPQPVSFTVKKNTLVIADTHGLHRRGDALPRMSRLEIWAYSRTNPFNPFPGLGLKIFSRIENRLAKAYWRYEDARAAKRNKQSSWHLVPIERMRDTA